MNRNLIPSASLVLVLLFGFFSAKNVSAELVFSHQRGFYDAPFDLVVETDLPNAGIRYTTDGSAPTAEYGSMYAEPITIDRPTVVRVIAFAGEATEESTHTYLFAGMVAEQEAFPEAYIKEIESGRNGSDRPHTFDWAMDPEVLEDTENNGNLVEHLLSLPTLALTMDVEDFNYIYENHTQRGSNYERATAVELIYPDHERYADFEGFQVVSGIRMQGGGAVDQARKKSFRLLFKDEYGFSKLGYPLFESAVHHADSATRRFDNVVLRAAGNTNWSKDDAWKHEPSTYLRDPFSRDSQVAISGFGARSTFVHVYINGYYFGLYNIAERPDDKFMASYFGGEREDYYSINHGGTVEGDEDEWDSLTSTSALLNLSEDEEYAAFIKRFDVKGYSDYVLLNWLIGMGDWPWNNFYGGIRNEPDGKLRFFSWDSEYAFWTIDGYLGSNPGAWVNPFFSNHSGDISKLWRGLRDNDQFLRTFADRVYQHCFNDGPLTDENMRARFLRLAGSIEGAIVAESARWGDSSWGREDDPHTRKDDWEPNVAKVLALIEGNVEQFIQTLRAEGYYPANDPPVIARPVMVAPGYAFTLENPNGAGEIYYSLDGSDPAGATGVLYAAGSEIVIKEEAHFRARVKNGNEWSAAAQHHFQMEGVGFPLRITEIFYHPSDEGEALEFVEIQNVGTLAHDLSGFYFRGIDYRFPPDTVLPAQGTMVVVRNDVPEAFAEAYPDAVVSGYFRGRLDNGGERISLRDPFGVTVDSVRYDDKAPWPEGEGGADGGGLSISRVNLIGESDTGANWVATEASPGVVAGFAPVGLPELTAVVSDDPLTVALRFSAVAGQSYRVEYSSTLDGAWELLQEVSPQDSAGDVTVSDTPAAGVEERYYRLALP